MKVGDMIINNVCIAATAVSEKQYPVSALPEFAFVGKSNVGKSSLINCMVNRRLLARTSQNPGKTRTINFYNVEDRLYFVDLPGYGYAKISKAVSEKWGVMIEGYLLRRVQLRDIVFLLDIRHEPSENDKMMYDWFKYYNKSVITVATKSDKLSNNERQSALSVIRKTLDMEKNDLLLPFSSETKQGREELWGILLDRTE